MRKLLRYILLASLISATGYMTEADAERVTTRRVRVMKKPGRTSRVVKRAPAGTPVKVLARRGRWVKVRIGGSSGWIQSSSIGKGEDRATPPKQRRKPRQARKRKKAFVKGGSKTRSKRSRRAPRSRRGRDAVRDDQFDEDEKEVADSRAWRKRKTPKRRARKRKKKVSFNDEEEEIPALGKASKQKPVRKQKDSEEAPAEKKPKKKKREKRVMFASVDASLMKKPRSSADEIIEILEGEQLFYVRKSRRGNWTYVRTDYGDEGWIRSDDIRQPQSSKVYGKWGVQMDAGLGFTNESSTFAADTFANNAPMSRYSLTSNTVDVAVNANMHYSLTKNLLMKGDFNYQYGMAVPGIAYSDGTNTATIGYATQRIDAGLAVGYNFNNKQGIAVLGRLGFHWDHFGVKNVASMEANPAYLPSEAVTGPTVGARLLMPRLLNKFGATITFDAMPILASRKQTTGLEDGAQSSMHAIYTGARLFYRWKDNWVIRASYRLNYEKTTWSGAAPNSARPHGATSAARKDMAHSVVVGMGLQF